MERQLDNVEAEDRIEAFIDQHHVPEEQEDTLILTLAMADFFANKKVNYAKRYMKLYKKNLPHRAFLTSWLQAVEATVPKFYFVVKRHDKKLTTLVDFSTGEFNHAYVSDPTARPIYEGSIVMGMLLPMGDKLHATYFDFYHFHQAPSKQMFQMIDTHY